MKRLNGAIEFAGFRRSIRMHQDSGRRKQIRQKRFCERINRVNREEWFRVQVEEEHRPTRSNMVVVGEELERRSEVIVGQRARLEVRRNFFTVRVEKEWNCLPEVVKMQRTVNGFKNAYDRWRQGVPHTSNTWEKGDQVQGQQETVDGLVQN